MEFLKTYLDLMVFGTLGLMAFTAVWFTLERLFFYRHFQVSQYDHLEKLQIDLTQNLTTLSTIAANAPYVGLLGTVVGILLTFYDLGHQDTLDTSAIMMGLALALKATAAGILVAIPAVMSYNGLMRKVDVFSALYQAEKDLGRLK